MTQNLTKSEAYKRTFKRLYNVIRNDLNLKNFDTLSDLLSDNVITWNDHGEIMNKEVPHKMAESLLGMMATGWDLWKFHKFIEILAKYQKDLTSVITQEFHQQLITLGLAPANTSLRTNGIVLLFCRI